MRLVGGSAITSLPGATCCVKHCHSETGASSSPVHACRGLKCCCVFCMAPVVFPTFTLHDQVPGMPQGCLEWWLLGDAGVIYSCWQWAI